MRFFVKNAAVVSASLLVFASCPWKIDSTSGVYCKTPSNDNSNFDGECKVEFSISVNGQSSCVLFNDGNIKSYNASVDLLQLDTISAAMIDSRSKEILGESGHRPFLFRIGRLSRAGTVVSSFDSLTPHSHFSIPSMREGNKYKLKLKLGDNPPPRREDDEATVRLARCFGE